VKIRSTDTRPPSSVFSESSQSWPKVTLFDRKTGTVSQRPHTLFSSFCFCFCFGLPSDRLFQFAFFQVWDNSIWLASIRSLVGRVRWRWLHHRFKTVFEHKKKWDERERESGLIWQPNEAVQRELAKVRKQIVHFTSTEITYDLAANSLVGGPFSSSRSSQSGCHLSCESGECRGISHEKSLEDSKIRGFGISERRRIASVSSLPVRASNTPSKRACWRWNVYASLRKRGCVDGIAQVWFVPRADHLQKFGKTQAKTPWIRSTVHSASGIDSNSRQEVLRMNVIALRLAGLRDIPGRYFARRRSRSEVTTRY
jgi:hypothetical protein